MSSGVGREREVASRTLQRTLERGGVLMQQWRAWLQSRVNADGEEQRSGDAEVADSLAHLRQQLHAERNTARALGDDIKDVVDASWALHEELQDLEAALSGGWTPPTDWAQQKPLGAGAPCQADGSGPLGNEHAAEAPLRSAESSHGCARATHLLCCNYAGWGPLGYSELHCGERVRHLRNWPGVPSACYAVVLRLANASMTVLPRHVLLPIFPRHALTGSCGERATMVLSYPTPSWEDSTGGSPRFRAGDRVYLWEHLREEQTSVFVHESPPGSLGRPTRVAVWLFALDPRDQANSEGSLMPNCKLSDN